MAALSGWSQSAVYEAVRKLEDAGLIASVPHGTELVPPTRRFHLSAAGLRRLAQDENAALDDLLRDRPVSARWRRVLLERLDALAVIYRLAADVSNLAYPRPLPLVPRHAAGRRPDPARRQDRRHRPAGPHRRQDGLLQAALAAHPGAAPRRRVPADARRGAAAPCPKAARPEPRRGPLRAWRARAVAATLDDPVWRLRSVNAAVGLRAAIDRLPPGGSIPAEQPLARTSMPEDIDENGTGRGVPEHMLPALLKPAEKRVLDLLSDWPWLTLDDLAGLLERDLSAGLQAHLRPRRLRPDRADPRSAPANGPDQPGAGRAGPEGPLLRRRGQEAVERRAHGRRRLAQRLRQAQPPAAARHAAHRSRPRLHRGPGDPGPRHRLGDRPARSAHPRLALPPAPGRVCAPSTPMPSAYCSAGRRRLALLSGVGAQGRPSRDDGRPARPLPALLLLPPAHRRPRREARRPGGLPRRASPSPTSCAWRPRRWSAQGPPFPCWSPTARLLEREGPLGRAWLAPGEGFEPDFPLPQPATNQSKTGDRTS